MLRGGQHESGGMGLEEGMVRHSRLKNFLSFWGILLPLAFLVVGFAIFV